MMSAQHNDKSDRELLIELHNDMRWVKSIIEKHLAHHSKLFYAGLGVATSVIISLVLILLGK